ncbi:hypothetical protein N5D83_24655 [Pseudomonas chengduensis]|nr:hypothetical protein [Pseudomonas chengduensis]MDH1869983.1 hypothetical protein [Pseudomonas chengduensis]
MRAIVQWHTQTGKRMADNRDAYAHMDLPHASFYLVADGSSRHPGSGELANALLAELIQGFGRLPATALNRERLPSLEANRSTAARSVTASTDVSG